MAINSHDLQSGQKAISFFLQILALIFGSLKCVFPKCTFAGPQLSRRGLVWIFLIRQKPTLRTGLIMTADRLTWPACPQPSSSCPPPQSPRRSHPCGPRSPGPGPRWGEGGDRDNGCGVLWGVSGVVLGCKVGFVVLKCCQAVLVGCYAQELHSLKNIAD